VATLKVFNYFYFTLSKQKMDQMKSVKIAAVLFTLLLSQGIKAQHISLMEGNLSPLKSESTIVVQFAYDNMRVGKYDKEADFISAKKDDYNRKEPGRGDNWAKNWVGDRKSRYEPKFLELFEKHSGLTNSPNAKYSLIFKTVFTEPGFNVGIAKKNAEIDAEAWVVETANPSNVIAKISIHNAPGRTFTGNDYDAGERISESYAVAGKGLGKFMKK
jgi:hypothetical protein